MNKLLRKVIIAGNWKMNKTSSETLKFLAELKCCVKKAPCEVVVCVPFVDLQNAVEITKDSNIKVGAQNLFFEKSGAYTGEISAEMLKDLGVEYVIIGHSERRQHFNETDISVNKKVHAALEAKLKPIICVGELLEQREQGITAEIVSLQTKIALKDVSAENLENIVIAYEPVWAIGTGRTATSDQADEVCKIIRDVIAGLFGNDKAQAVTIQYGGSMNANNAEELLSKENVDGGLIGGASLIADAFATIVSAAK